MTSSAFGNSFEERLDPPRALEHDDPARQAERAGEKRARQHDQTARRRHQGKRRPEPCAATTEYDVETLHR